MNLSRFINRPVLSTVISILLVILGFIGLATLPVTQYPDIAPPTISVSATYTGANAQTVLNAVISPLEDQINGVENMMYMTSDASNNGSASITVYFNQGTDPDMAQVNVQNRVTAAEGLLPQEVTQIGVTTRKRQSSMLMIFSIYDMEDKYNIEFIENYANINIIPEIKRVAGVGDASSRRTSARPWPNRTSRPPRDNSANAATNPSSTPSVTADACNRLKSSRASSSSPWPTDKCCA